MADTTASRRELHCVVVTPEKAFIDEVADFVSVPLYDGELGILPGRAALVGRLGYGPLRIRKGGEVRKFFVDGGFVQVRANVVTVLTPRALKVEEIEPGKARAALAEARSAQKKAHTPEEQEANLKAQERARAQLRLVGQGVGSGHA